MTTPNTPAGVPVLAIGTILQRSDMAPTTPAFTDIAMMRSVTGPSFKTTTKDVTAHDSPGRAIQRMATLLDPGDMKFKINLNPIDPSHSTSTGIMSDWLALQLTDYKLVLPTVPATTWDLTAMVTDMGIALAVDDVMLADITLTNFGLPDFTGTLLAAQGAPAQTPAAAPRSNGGNSAPAAAAS
jgi:hypothetical protein